MHTVIEARLDDGEFCEIHSEFAKTSSAASDG